MKRHSDDSSPADRQAWTRRRIRGRRRSGSFDGARTCDWPVRLLLLLLLLAMISAALSRTVEGLSSPASMPSAATCLTGGARNNATQVELEPAREELNGLVQRTQNSILILSSSSKQQPVARQQLALRTICAGWRNNLDGSPSKPSALWAYDTARGALVAKFIYYERHELYDPGHFAKLTSPPFKPIPAYHFIPESRYFESCKIRFSSYMTISAHLDLNLFFVPTTASSSALGKNIQIQEPIKIDSIIQGSNPRTLQSSDKSSESSIWRRHEYTLPTNQQGSHYQFEFSATPSKVDSNAVTQKKGLHGIAISNISLTAQCFGLAVEPEEIERLRSMGKYWPPEVAAEESENGGVLGESSSNEEERIDKSKQGKTWELFLQHNKSLIVLTSSTVLVIYLLLHLFFHIKQRKQQRSSSINNLPGQKHYLPKPPKSLLVRLFCCCLDDFRRGRRHRVYEQNSTSKSNHLKNAEHGKKLASDGPEAGELEEDEELHYYLRPLQSLMFENVELNENPNYLTNDALLLPAISANYRHSNGLQLSGKVAEQLKPYMIDRKRLTMTNELGKGAFGAVYQGYLVCYCDESGRRAFNKPTRATSGLELDSRYQNMSAGGQDEQDDDHETHSMKVAVKTLSDERMSVNDFILEAHKLSLVSHRNIVELVGVCFEGKPFYIVMELLEGGNLKEFLLRNRDRAPSSFACPRDSSSANGSGRQAGQQPPPSSPAPERLKLSMGDLLVFALDIARAFDYLEKKQFIHRDLAARNCLLTSNLRAAPPTPLPGNSPRGSEMSQNSAGGGHLRSLLGGPGGPAPSRPLPSALEVDGMHKVDLETVFLNGFQNSSMVAKLADFGMTRDIYYDDYYRTEHKEMPVRWAAPECLINGVATTKSDVWSFGVFLWELFSMGQLPYQRLHRNVDVIDFIKRRSLLRPKSSPSQLNQQPPPSASSTRSFCNDQQELLLTINHHNQRLQMDYHDGQPGPPAAQPPEELAPPLEDSDDCQQAPLPPPHHHTPTPVYSIMCACWAMEPEERPQFEEIANRLYWCLTMPEVLNSNLPCF